MEHLKIAAKQVSSIMNEQNSNKVYWPIDFYCINTTHTLASINKFRWNFSNYSKHTLKCLLGNRVMIMFVSIVHFYWILDCNRNCELIELELIPLSFSPFQIIFKFIEITALTISSSAEQMKTSLKNFFV